MLWNNGGATFQPKIGGGPLLSKLATGYEILVLQGSTVEDL